MSSIRILLGGIAAGLTIGLASAPDAAAKTITGVYNTGASEVEDADDASLDLRFHACEEAPELTCATIVRVIEPNGPSGEDTLPNGEHVIGFQMIEGLEYRGEGKYRNGRINAVDESMSKDKMVWYGLKINDNGDGALTAKGCLAFICPRTMVWTEVVEPSDD